MEQIRTLFVLILVSFFATPSFAREPRLVPADVQDDCEVIETVAEGSCFSRQVYRNYAWMVSWTRFKRYNRHLARPDFNLVYHGDEVCIPSADAVLESGLPPALARKMEREVESRLAANRNRVDEAEGAEQERTTPSDAGQLRPEMCGDICAAACAGPNPANCLSECREDCRRDSGGSLVNYTSKLLKVNWELRQELAGSRIEREAPGSSPTLTTRRFAVSLISLAILAFLLLGGWLLYRPLVKKIKTAYEANAALSQGVQEGARRVAELEERNDALLGERGDLQVALDAQRAESERLAAEVERQARELDGRATIHEVLERYLGATVASDVVELLGDAVGAMRNQPGVRELLAAALQQPDKIADSLRLFRGAEEEQTRLERVLDTIRFRRTRISSSARYEEIGRLDDWMRRLELANSGPISVHDEALGQIDAEVQRRMQEITPPDSEAPERSVRGELRFLAEVRRAMSSQSVR